MLVCVRKRRHPQGSSWTLCLLCFSISFCVSFAPLAIHIASPFNVAFSKSPKISLMAFHVNLIFWQASLFSSGASLCSDYVTAAWYVRLSAPRICVCFTWKTSALIRCLGGPKEQVSPLTIRYHYVLGNNRFWGGKDAAPELVASSVAFWPCSIVLGQILLRPFVPGDRGPITPCTEYWDLMGLADSNRNLRDVLTVIHLNLPSSINQGRKNKVEYECWWV